MARPSLSDKIVHPAKRAFLAAYRQTGNIRASTDAAEIARVTYYDWCEKDLMFAAAAQIAKEEYGDILEAKLNQMAVKHDNVTALIVALKMAGRFVEKTKNEHSGPDGTPISATFTFTIQTPSLDGTDGDLRPALPVPAAAERGLRP